MPTNVFTLAPADWGIVGGYFILVLILGIFHARRKEKTNEDFLIAGRRLSLIPFIATLVSTFYGGILGIGEFVYRYGIISWITQGLFYYFFAAIYALFLAGKIRTNIQFTLPDQLYDSYGKPAGVLGALVAFLMVTPAPYVLMVGVLLNLFLGWPLWLAILLGTLLSVVYVLFGGLYSVVKTDVFQFFLMFLGFATVLPFAWLHLGSPAHILSQLPPDHLKPTGYFSMQQILAWGFIALWTIVDPSFYQRCSAATSPKTARNGILISIAFWFVFDMMTLTAGFYARVGFPGINPLLAYPVLGNAVLPTLLKGFFVVGLLATIMSTLDSYTFLSAITLGRDFYGRLTGRLQLESLTQATRWGLIVTTLISFGIAYWLQSVVAIWYLIGSLGIPVLFFPLWTSFFPALKISPKFVTRQMALSGLASAGWLGMGLFHSIGGWPSYPFGIEPIYPGLAISFAFWLAGVSAPNKNMTS
ncbi:MAG: sodium:solute symporter family protein [Calditrichaeota bacterium]|nr:sodium:solute symporter family protein [Calditrichota bacterium]